MIIIQPISFYKHLGLTDIAKGLTIEKLILKVTIERLAIGIFPRAAWLNIQRTDTRIAEPPLDGIGNKLRTIVTADISRCPSNRKQIFQGCHDILSPDTSFHLNAQALSCVFIQNRQHLQWPAVFCLVHHKIIAPDMVNILCSFANAVVV